MIALNLVGTLKAIRTATAAFSPAFDLKFLIVSAFGFIVPIIWGFSARWVPVFLGLPPVRAGWLKLAILLNSIGVLLELVGLGGAGGVAFSAERRGFHCGLEAGEASPSAPENPGSPQNVPAVRPNCLRLAADRGRDWHCSSVLGSCGRVPRSIPACADCWLFFHHGTCYRTRVLPAFSGMKVLFSPRLMFASLSLLTLGCALRVSSEILAYESTPRSPGTSCQSLPVWS